MARATFPVLLSVTGCEALVVLSSWPLKVRALGATPATGAAVTAVPVKLTCCGLPLELSVTVSAPVRVPLAVGVKVMLNVQDAWTATLPPQLLVSEKSPLVETLLIVRVPVPVLLRVTGCDALAVPTAWLAKARVLGETPATGAGTKPVPVRLICCGLPVALSVTVRVPVRFPLAVGVKVTLNVHDEFTATLPPQLFVCEKSPLVEELPIVSPAVPALLSVTG